MPEVFFAAYDMGHCIQVPHIHGKCINKQVYKLQLSYKKSLNQYFVSQKFITQYTLNTCIDITEVWLALGYS